MPGKIDLKKKSIITLFQSHLDSPWLINFEIVENYDLEISAQNQNWCLSPHLSNRQGTSRLKKDSSNFSECGKHFCNLILDLLGFGATVVLGALRNNPSIPS